jgi:hypothetical protein
MVSSYLLGSNAPDNTVFRRSRLRGNDDAVRYLLAIL